MKRKFISKGCLWDDGEIPKCSYCGDDYDEAQKNGGLHETAINGTLCCGKAECVCDYALETFDLIEEKKHIKRKIKK